MPNPDFRGRIGTARVESAAGRDRSGRATAAAHVNSRVGEGLHAALFVRGRQPASIAHDRRDRTGRRGWNAARR